MIKVLQDAVEAASRLAPEVQDEIALAVMTMVATAEAGDSGSVIAMSAADEESFALSRAQAARGDFASDTRMQQIWSKEL